MTEEFDFGWEQKAGSFWMTGPGLARMKFQAGADLDGKKIFPRRWRKVAQKAGGCRFLAKTQEGQWTLKGLPVGAGDGLELSLELRLQKPVSSKLLHPLVVENLPADHLLTHGRKMGGCGIHLLKNGSQEAFESHFWVALTHKGVTLQFSHPLEQRDVSRFSGLRHGRSIRQLLASTGIEGPGRRILQSAPVTVSASPKGHQLMIDWAERQAPGNQPLEVPQTSGWNSWDYYRWTVSEEEVLKNADFIASDPILSRHVRTIMVDDGWQYCYGEWEANAHFPGGMKKLARSLEKMGFTPGLWFAPTIVEPQAHLAQIHPEVLLASMGKVPRLAFSGMGRQGFLIDPSHPWVRGWWDELFRRYAGYGFRHFKLDFLAWSLPFPRFADGKAKPGELMNLITEPIRMALGPSCQILGCNYEFGVPQGLVNEVRISSDIHAQWSSVKENVASIATRFWAHRRFWINDSDFVVCRGEETSKDPNLHRLKPLLPLVRSDDSNPEKVDYLSSMVDLRHHEAEVLISLVLISGGAMNLSDNLPRLNAKGLDLLRKAVVAEKGNAGIPVDLFQSACPSIWVQKLDSGLHRVLLVNWGESRKKLRVDLAELNVPRHALRNFWTQESVTIRRGRLEADLIPHSCLLVETKS